MVPAINNTKLLLFFNRDILAWHLFLFFVSTWCPYNLSNIMFSTFFRCAPTDRLTTGVENRLMFCTAKMFCAACSTKHLPIKGNRSLQKILTFLTKFISFCLKGLIFYKLHIGFGPLLPVDPNSLCSL